MGAMMNEDYQHFVCIVAGDNPDILIEEYRKKKVQPYVVYPFSSAKKIREQYLEAYDTFIKSDEMSEQEKEMLKIEYEMIEEDSDAEFFERITDQYKHDPITGDAISDENPNAEFSFVKMGGNFSIPFVKDDSTTTYQAYKKDIDWSVMHLGNQTPYRVAWETVMEKKTPENEYEKNIFNTMKKHKGYLKKFGDKDTYLVSSTAFWGYAFLSKETGWESLTDDKSQYEWVSTFFEKFIDPLPEDTILTIYECYK